MTDGLARAAEPAVRLRPDFHPAAILSRSGKSLLIAGHSDDGPTVAKLLTDHTPLWADKCLAEIRAYEAFGRTPPPVRVPRLIAADAHRHVLLIEHVRGRPPLSDRWSPHPLRPADLAAMLIALCCFSRWQPPPGAFTRAPDYRARLERDRRRGVITPQDLSALTDLLHQADTAAVPGHGDPLPTNFLLTADGQAALIDWEHAGRYLPGYDLALLWILLLATPGAREHIEGLIAAEPAPVQAAFTLNRAVLLARELHSHLQLPSSTWRDERVMALRRDFDHLREQLRASR
ncbi:phosphotransferase [Streptomyces sp. 549]|uniref:phosphotransferase n=1 Tax=Streptomyces sp. 549 TaxID=3049076 RepID=UPI0024C331D0|nr:phosphotransferase [Streptomyces sp. 549]MDK1474543.1 phosphotransferase [Streptomyces sp. 549]